MFEPRSLYARVEDLSRGSAEVDARRAHPTSFQAAKELAPYTHPKLTSIESRTCGRTHEDGCARRNGC